MANKNDFAARIARIEANAGKPAAVITPGPAVHPTRAARIRRPRPLFPRLMRTTFGLVGISFAVAMSANEMGALLPEGGWLKGTYLEQLVLGQTGDDEIAQMNADPGLAGQPQTEKRLLSN